MYVYDHGHLLFSLTPLLYIKPWSNILIYFLIAGAITGSCVIMALLHTSPWKPSPYTLPRWKPKQTERTHLHICYMEFNEPIHSPAWQSQSCCARSCWACWSSPPSLLHSLKPAGRCSYPASSARRQTAEPCCSTATTQEGVEIRAGVTIKRGRKNMNI